MRVLLDANIPQDFRHQLTGHEVETARFAGLADLDDGALLDRMAGRFDVLVTMDGNLVHQQNLAGRPFAIVILRASSSRMADVSQLASEVLEILISIAPGDVCSTSIA